MVDILDTILNVTVFVFIGVMIWLYFKEFQGYDTSGNLTNEEDDRGES